MTNMEIYDLGKNLGSFNYMDSDSLDEKYIGYLIEYQNMVYQIITNQNNVLVNPEDDAIPFAPSLDHVKNELRKKINEPIEVKTVTVNPDYFNTDSEFHKIDYEVLNEYMVNKIETNTLFDDNIDEIVSENYSQNIVKPKSNENGQSGSTFNNFVDFNRPW